MEEQNYPVGCRGVAAVAINHCGFESARECVLEGFSQQPVGCDPAHMEVCPCQDDFLLLFYCSVLIFF